VIIDQGLVEADDWRYSVIETSTGKVVGVETATDTQAYCDGWSNTLYGGESPESLKACEVTSCTRIGEGLGTDCP
jgi:hypothetical protein